MLVACALRNIKTSLSSVTDAPAFEAEELIKSILGISKTDIVLNQIEIDELSQKKLKSAVEKRLSGYPLQYIVGEWDFFGRSYKVGEGVLIPRSDTEALCEVAIDYSKDKSSLRILDLCSGSGCIAITLSFECKAGEVIAVEKEEKAYFYLQENIKNLNAKVKAVRGDVLSDSFSFEPFDIIVSNPPYLTKEDMESLQKEVTFEPRSALFGDSDGLLFYREITKKFKGLLKKGGLLAFEIGINQAPDVSDILLSNGFTRVYNKPDLNGVQRVIYSIKN